MQTIKWWGWGTVGVLLLIPGIAGAAMFVSNKEGAVTTTEELTEDLYIAGNGVTVDKAVEDDIFAAGNIVDIRTNGGADVYAAGNTVRISGNYGDDITAAGNSVVVGAKAEDIMAAGSTVEVTSNSDLSGQAYLAGGVVIISGKIGGTTRVAGDHVEIKKGAEINGDLIVYSEKMPTIEEGAVITGERRLETPRKDTKAAAGAFDVFNWIRSIFSLFVVALLILYVFPGFTKERVAYALASGGKAFGLGLIWMLLLVPVFILLLVTVVGIPLALGLLGKTAVLIVAAGGLAALLSGRWLMKLATKQEGELTWQHALVGAVALSLIGLVPILGGLVVVVVGLIAFGAVEIGLWNKLRETGIPKEA